MTTVADLAEQLYDPRKLKRMRAIQALGKIGGPEATKLLFEKHDDETEKPMVRNLAMDALVDIGTKEVADGLEKRLAGYPSDRGRRVVGKKIEKIRQSL